MDFNISCDKLIIVGFVADIEKFRDLVCNPYKFPFLEIGKPNNTLYKYRTLVKAPNLYFMVGLNHYDKLYHSQIKIIYNPNKPYMSSPDDTSDYDSNKFFDMLLGCLRKYRLYECDIACDYYNIERERCYFVNNPRCSYSYMRTNGITEYSGKHHTHGYTKLYDKQKESNLDYACVRLEHTFMDKHNFEFIPHFYYVADCSDCDNALIQLMVSAGSDAFNRYFYSLSYKTRQKYLSLLNKSYFSSISQYELMFNMYCELFDKYTFSTYIADCDDATDFYFASDDEVGVIFEKV